MKKSTKTLGRLLVDALAVEEMKKQIPAAEDPLPSRLSRLLQNLENAERTSTALKWDTFTVSTPRDPDWLN
jgi:hypothetical protein